VTNLTPCLVVVGFVIGFADARPQLGWCEVAISWQIELQTASRDHQRTQDFCWTSPLAAYHPFALLEMITSSGREKKRRGATFESFPSGFVAATFRDLQYTSYKVLTKTVWCKPLWLQLCHPKFRLMIQFLSRWRWSPTITGTNKVEFLKAWV